MYYLVNHTDLPVSEAFLEWFFQQINQRLPIAEKQSLVGLDVGVVFVGEEQSAQLNEQFRNKKGPTDILSFAGTEEGVLGELVICDQKLMTQAQDNQHHLSEELVYLLVHGVLHLLGHDHEVTAEAVKMYAIQDQMFEELAKEGIVKVFEAK